MRQSLDTAYVAHAAQAGGPLREFIGRVIPEKAGLVEWATGCGPGGWGRQVEAGSGGQTTTLSGPDQVPPCHKRAHLGKLAIGQPRERPRVRFVVDDLGPYPSLDEPVDLVDAPPNAIQNFDQVSGLEIQLSGKHDCRPWVASPIRGDPNCITYQQFGGTDHKRFKFLSLPAGVACAKQEPNRKVPAQSLALLLSPRPRRPGTTSRTRPSPPAARLARCCSRPACQA